MAVNLGISNISTVKLGAADVSKIYLGLDVVFNSVAPFEFSNALQFDGINDTVSSSDIGVVSSSYQNCTISFWSKRISSPTSIIEFFFSTGANTANRLIFQDRQDLSKYRVTINSASIDYTTYLTDTNWHHFFFVYDGSQVSNIDRCKMYIDGVLNSATTVSGTLPTSLDQSVLRFPVIGGTQGSNTAGTLRRYTGVMDEFCFWLNVSGTGADAALLYNSGLGNFADQVISNPDRYYRLNGSGTDTTAIDDSGNSNTGTLNNFTTPPDYWVAH